MPWQDRLKEAAYTGPVSGQRITYEFEDVSRSFDNKTTAFDFPDADGTYVQNLGKTGRRFPIRAFFAGEDYDLKAAAFEQLLGEAGVGQLEHPAYGRVDVVPFGTIERRDDLKSAANQAVIEVTFWETTGIVYPTGQADPATAVVSALDAYNAAIAQQFADSLGLETAGERTSFKGTFQNLLKTAKTGLQSIADAQESVSRTFSGIYESINQGIDTLVGTPIDLAFQTTLLIQAPALAATSIQARLSAYRDLAESIISGNGAVVSNGTDDTNANKYHTRDLYASGYVTGSVSSTVNNQFETKTDALAAAAELLDLFGSVAAWRDANYESLEQIDTGAAYQQLQEAVSLAAGYLVYISFSLKQERAVTLTRARTIIDLAAELYGSVDAVLDFFILSNKFSGSEILEIPAGRRVVYYV